MAPKLCRVSFVDREGVEHTVEVEASSVYEAAAKALRRFGQSDWAAEGRDWTGALKIIVKQPEVEHKVLLGNFNGFLSREGGSPRDVIQREKLKAILRRQARISRITPARHQNAKWSLQKTKARLPA